MTATTWLMVLLGLAAVIVVITASTERQLVPGLGTSVAFAIVFLAPAATLGLTSRGIHEDLTGRAEFLDWDWLRFGLQFSFAWAAALSLMLIRPGRGLERVVPVILAGMLLSFGLAQVYAWEIRDTNAYVSATALPQARATAADVPSEIAFENEVEAPAIVTNRAWLATYNDFAQSHDGIRTVDPTDTTRRQLFASVLGLLVAAIVFTVAARLRGGDSDGRFRIHLLAAGAFAVLVLGALPASLNTTLPALISVAGATVTLFELTKVVAVIAFAFSIRALAEGAPLGKPAVIGCAGATAILIMTDLGAGLTIGAIGLTMTSVIIVHRRWRMVLVVLLASIPLLAPVAVSALGSDLPGAAAVRIEDWTSPWESHDEATIGNLSRNAAADIEAALALRRDPVPWDRALSLIQQELAFRVDTVDGDTNALPVIPVDRTDELLLAEAEQAWADLGGYRLVNGELDEEVVVNRLERWLDHLQARGQGVTIIPRQDGFQLQRSLYALRAGGVMGQGLGQGRPEAIPTVTEDLAIVAWGESTGLVGIITAAGGLLLLTSFALRRADEGLLLASLLIIGLGSQYAIQAIINAGGIIGALPFTGIPFPFLSRSGTAAIGTGLAVGLLAAVLDRQADRTWKHERITAPETLGLAMGLSVVLLAFAVLMTTGDRLLTSGPLFARLDDLEREHLTVADQWENTDYRSVPGPILDRNGVVLLHSPDLGVGRQAPDAELGRASSHVLRELSNTYASALRPGGDDMVGPPLITTLDAEVQRVAHQAFDLVKGNIVELDVVAEVRGAAVVIDTTTGDLVAFVSRPSFAPDELGNVSLWSSAEGEDRRGGFSSRFLNRAFDGLYPPASTFKTVTAAGALEEGLHQVGVEDFIYDSGPLGMRPADDEHPEPWQQLEIPDGPPITGSNLADVDDLQLDIAEAFAHSSNIAFAEMGIELGAEALVETARRFGFETPITVPGLGTTVSSLDTEIDAPVEDRPVGGTIDLLARTSFGQGEVLATPLQMALVSAAIANDGIIMAPRIVQRVGSGRVPDEPTVLVDTGFGASTLSGLRAMFAATVDYGTAQDAAVSPENGAPSVGGKTGTAEWAAGSTAHSWFISAFPNDQPRLAVAVIVEQGGPGGGAATQITQLILSSDAVRNYLEAVGDG